MERKNTREVRIGDRVIGGGNPILIQSMTNTKTEDAAATVSQIHQLRRRAATSSAALCPTRKRPRL